MANQCLSKRFPKAVEQLSRQSNKLPVLKQKKSTADFWLLSWWKKDVTARSTFYEHKFHKSLVVLSTGKAGLYHNICADFFQNKQLISDIHTLQPDLNADGIKEEFSHQDWCSALTELTHEEHVIPALGMSFMSECADESKTYSIQNA